MTAFFASTTLSIRLLTMVSFLSTVRLLVHGSNPIVPNVGMADPHVHYFDNTYYVYATHDFAPNNTGFLMKDWWIWSSNDLVTWTQKAIVTPDQTPAPHNAYDECWATDGAQSSVDNSYYFYLSMGPGEIGVMQSLTTPFGPWNNTLGEPLINASLGPSLNPPTTSRDPCVFRDIDGNHYLIFGVFEYYIVRLTPDLMHLAETPRYVTVNNPTGPYGNSTDDKPFIHTRYNPVTNQQLYYLTWGCFYGISTSVYGPYNYTGTVVNTENIEPAFRMNQTNGPWYGWEDYADRHGSFWTVNNQWYYACNDRSHSTDAKNPSVYRDTVISYVNYYNNGTMAYVTIDETGVGEYNGQYRIEVEHYYRLSNQRHNNDGTPSLYTYPYHDERNNIFIIYNLTVDTVLTYPHIRKTNRNSNTLSLRIANGRTDKQEYNITVTIIPRIMNEDDKNNEQQERTELCTVPLLFTGTWDTYADILCRWSLPLVLPLDFTLELTFDQNTVNNVQDGLSIATLDSFLFV